MTPIRPVVQLVINVIGGITVFVITKIIERKWFRSKPTEK